MRLLQVFDYAASPPRNARVLVWTRLAEPCAEQRLGRLHKRVVIDGPAADRIICPGP